jgi:hypothetical protein
MTHWFPLGLETLAHKTEVLTRHCETIGRDPATIERTMATPVLLATDKAASDRLLARLPPERRASVATTAEQAAEALRPYIDAGFTGFTFNNPILSNPDVIGLAGETLRLIS